MITKNLSQVQVNWRIEAESQTEMPSFIFKLSIEETPTRLTYEGGGPQFFMELQFYSLPSDRPIPLISTRHNHVEPNPLEVLTELLVPQLLPCIFNHPDCNSYLYFPPRLIDVGPPDGSVDPVLIESKTITESMDIDKQKLSVHATLSHCWGDAEHHVTTTTKNIDERMTCIPMSSLNKTFQDAITIVRALNREGLKLRYLWIDSICIIQDSKEDWERHSRMMSYIYSNSLVNIAATSAFNGSEGILHDRISGVELPLSPGISSPDRESTNLWIRALSPVEGSTLDSRAWVVQETILAPRTLYFGRNEASFRCRLLHCSEIHGINNVAVWHPDAKRSYFNLHQNFGEVIFDGLREYGEYGPAFKAWQRVVEVYSEKKLKFHRDKLPAISGIARHLVCELQFSHSRILCFFETDISPTLSFITQHSMHITNLIRRRPYARSRMFRTQRRALREPNRSIMQKQERNANTTLASGAGTSSPDFAGMLVWIPKAVNIEIISLQAGVGYRRMDPSSTYGGEFSRGASLLLKSWMLMLI